LYNVMYSVFEFAYRYKLFVNIVHATGAI